MITIAYKVVFVEDENHWMSTVACHDERVNYKTRAWIKPKDGYNPFLFVFATYKNAKHYVQRCIIANQSKYKILRVLADSPVTIVYDSTGKPLVNCIDYPMGTLFVKRVKVIYSSRTVYKVVTKEGASASGNGRRYGRSVYYKLNQISIPNDGADIRQFLFTFNTLDDASVFLRQFVSDGGVIFKSLAFNYNKTRSHRDNVIQANTYPEGTFFVDAVLPLEKVN